MWKGVAGNSQSRGAKRKGKRFGMIVFSSISFALAILAIANISQRDIPMSIVYSVGALAFPALLIWSAFANK